MSHEVADKADHLKEIAELRHLLRGALEFVTPWGEKLRCYMKASDKRRDRLHKQITQALADTDHLKTEKLHMSHAEKDHFICEVVDGDDIAGPHLNAKYQAELFYKLFIAKKYGEAAAVAKALEISAKQLIRATYAVADKDGQPARKEEA